MEIGSADLSKNKLILKRCGFSEKLSCQFSKIVVYQLHGGAPCGGAFVKNGSYVVWRGNINNAINQEA